MEIPFSRILRDQAKHGFQILPTQTEFFMNYVNLYYFHRSFISFQTNKLTWEFKWNAFQNEKWLKKLFAAIYFDTVTLHILLKNSQNNSLSYMFKSLLNMVSLTFSYEKKIKNPSLQNS